MKLRKKRFTAEVLSGHKESALEVPFDPMKEWNVLPRSLWRGRRGHPVKATVNSFSFESAIVSRQKRFYLLLDAEAATASHSRSSRWNGSLSKTARFIG